MKQFLNNMYWYLISDNPRGWMQVLFHDLAVLSIFFVITQIFAIGAMISMYLGVAPTSDEQVFKDVQFSVIFFSTIMAIVYGAVLLLRIKDYLSRKPSQQSDSESASP